MIRVIELLTWLASSAISPSDFVAVDEDGLTLVIVSWKNGTVAEPYIEVGGVVPLSDQDG